MPQKKTKNGAPRGSGQKRLNTKTLSTLLDCITRLAEGQLKFAEEFGLGADRVAQQLADDHLPPEIDAWLREGEAGIDKIQQLFTALTHHQLALVAALDSVAVQAIKVLTPKPLQKNIKRRLKELLKKQKQDHSIWEDLKTNQHLRYQHIIVPGFVESYIRTRAQLQGEIL